MLSDVSFDIGPVKNTFTLFWKYKVIVTFTAWLKPPIAFSLEYGPKVWLVTLQVTTWRTSSRWWRSLSTSGNGNRSSLVGRSCFSSTKTSTTSCPSAPTWASSSRSSTSSAWPSSTTSRPNREQVQIGVVRGFASRQMGESLYKAAQSVVQASKEAIFIP